MNVLAIGAHYDDIELGVGGTIAKHISNGDDVTLVTVTDSSYSGLDNKMLRTKEQARKEGSAAAKILGANVPICLEYETKRGIYGVDLIEDLNKIIVDNKIEIIYTHWINDVHQDHSSVAKATLNAGRHIPRILMYRSNWYHTNASFNENFYSNISDFIEKKIESLKAHATEYSRRGDAWIDFVKHQNRNCGIGIGVKYAESFEAVKWLY